MFNLFHKERTEFYSLMPGVEFLYPPTLASEYKPEWYKKASSAYKDLKKTCPFKKITTTLNCPGIRDLLGSGYIVYNYQDVVIHTHEDGALEWAYPVEQSSHNQQLDKYIVHMRTDLLTDFMQPPVGASKYIIKFHLPWRVRCPSNEVLLMLPLHYTEDSNLQACVGILDTKISRAVHVQAWWFGKPGVTTTIRAGTPIAQLLPVRRDMICKTEAPIIRCGTHDDILKEYEALYFFHSTFNTKETNFRNKNAERINT